MSPPTNPRAKIKIGICVVSCDHSRAERVDYLLSGLALHAAQQVAPVHRPNARILPGRPTRGVFKIAEGAKEFRVIVALDTDAQRIALGENGLVPDAPLFALPAELTALVFARVQRDVNGPSRLILFDHVTPHGVVECILIVQLARATAPRENNVYFAVPKGKPHANVNMGCFAFLQLYTIYSRPTTGNALGAESLADFAPLRGGVDTLGGQGEPPKGIPFLVHMKGDKCFPACPCRSG